MSASRLCGDAPILSFSLIRRDADEFGIVVFDRRDHFLFLRIPPLVRHNAVSVAVGAGEQRGVARSGAGVGVIVVAVGEVGAVVEEQAESAFAELGAVALQIVAAELIDDDHDDQLGMGVVGRGEGGRNGDWVRSEDESGHDGQQKTTARSNGAGEESHRRRVVYTGGQLARKPSSLGYCHCSQLKMSRLRAAVYQEANASLNKEGSKRVDNADGQ